MIPDMMQLYLLMMYECLYMQLCYRKAVGLDLSDLGIMYMYAGTNQGQTEQQVVQMRECSVCKLRGSKDLFRTWYMYIIISYFLRHSTANDHLFFCGFQPVLCFKIPRRLNLKKN